MKCIIQRTAPVDPETALMKNLPTGTLFMPTKQDVNYRNGPGLIVQRFDELGVVWLGSKEITAMPVGNSASRSMPVKVLDRGEYVVLEND